MLVLLLSLLLTACLRATAQGLVVGRLILDDIISTCTASQQADISLAAEEAHKLTDAAQNFAGDDPSFTAYFGAGYSGPVFGKRFGLVSSNLQRAGSVLQVGSSEAPVARVRCGSATECPDSSMMRTSNNADGSGTIVVCPFAFLKGNRTPNLRHIAELVQSGTTSTDLEDFRSWEYILLHEIMHLDNVGYTTPYDTTQVSSFRSTTNSVNHSTLNVSSAEHDDQLIHAVGDARAFLAGRVPDPGFNDKFTSLYGPTFVKQYAKQNSPPVSKKPPTLALVNADTYALFAASRFFSQQFRGTITRRQVDGDNADADPGDLVDLGTGQDLGDPEEACSAISQPLTEDCQQIQQAMVVSDNSQVNYGSACYTNGNRKWCDVYTFESCQVSVGWDTTVSGDSGPTLFNNFLAEDLEGAALGPSLCSPFFKDNPKVCAIQRAPVSTCTTPYTFCVKRVGQDCRPGVNPDVVIAGPGSPPPNNLINVLAVSPSAGDASSARLTLHSPDAHTMTLHLGMSHAHHRSPQQQQQIKEAKRELRDRLRNDWDYPPLPAFQTPVRRREVAGEDEDRVAGFKFHTPAHYQTGVAAKPGEAPYLYFEPVEWREREYSSEESSDNESVATASTGGSGGSKKSNYRFEGPDSVGSQIQNRKDARKRKRQKALDEEVKWNDGLAHWITRRDAWCAAHTSQQVQILESKKNEQIVAVSALESASASPNTTPRTSTSSTSSTSAVISSPSTTPELPQQTIINTRPPAPPSEILVPLAPTLFPNHPIRKRIKAEVFPEIYGKIILQSRTPSVPINLAVLMKALIQGWKDDGEWPPKQGPVEKSIGRKKSSGHESSLKSGVKAMGRVLRITGGESSVGGGKEKG
ncbi:uncharacterized protein LTR77_000492 [Saxophila tyrrhenica]|uniref:Gag1-like clamp domain-containing protein n=1 Tax=Saxophila tyrrhenica TaxID=1690608 RepID=A0AAV9PQ15_9PEZI|nr:hypothetical protein LTR77_000492 [Saxophila tyrrhenica]